MKRRWTCRDVVNGMAISCARTVVSRSQFRMCLDDCDVAMYRYVSSPAFPIDC